MAAWGSYAIREYNSMGERAYVIYPIREKALCCYERLSLQITITPHESTTEPHDHSGDEGI